MNELVCVPDLFVKSFALIISLDRSLGFMTNETKAGLFYLKPQPAGMLIPVCGQQGSHALTAKGISPLACACRAD